MGTLCAHTGAIGCIVLSKPANGFYLPVAPALVVICVGVNSDGLFTDGKSTTNQGWTPVAMLACGSQGNTACCSNGSSLLSLSKTNRLSL